jgi:hypothetical protein
MSNKSAFLTKKKGKSSAALSSKGQFFYKKNSSGLLVGLLGNKSPRNYQPNSQKHPIFRGD